MFFYSKKGEIKILKEHASNSDALSFIQAWQESPDQLEVKTSGSTGDPKTILLLHNQIIASVKGSASYFGWSSDNLFVCNLSIESIAGKLMLIRALELNAALIFIHPDSKPLETLSQFQDLIELYSNKLIFAFVPLQLESSLNNANHIRILNWAQTILVGGAAVSNILSQKISKLDSPVFATYGMTETVTHIAAKRLNGSKPQKYFEIMPKVSIQLSPNNCLMIKALQTNMNWIATNDIVKLIDDKHFEYIGRKDNIINSGGIKIQLEQIEKKIASSTQEPYSFFAFGLADEILGQALSIAFIPSRNAMKVFNKRFMKEVLPKFEVPKFYFPIDKFELTPSGKIDKIKTINVIIRDQVSD